MKITEVCACGGSVTVEDIDGPGRLAIAAARVKDWRDNHAHLGTVGICGNQLRFTDGTPAAYCKLAANHDGMHSDGDDGHWRVMSPLETTGPAT